MSESRNVYFAVWRENLRAQIFDLNYIGSILNVGIYKYIFSAIWRENVRAQILDLYLSRDQEMCTLRFDEKICARKFELC